MRFNKKRGKKCDKKILSLFAMVIEMVFIQFVVCFSSPRQGSGIKKHISWKKKSLTIANHERSCIYCLQKGSKLNKSILLFTKVHSIRFVYLCILHVFKTTVVINYMYPIDENLTSCKIICLNPFYIYHV